jgi:PPM family protein phosphatase
MATEFSSGSSSLFSSGDFLLKAHGITHTGRVRKTNEDAFATDPTTGLFAVADGMGGHNAGEVAAQLAIDTLRAFLSRSAAGKDCTWPFGIDPRLTFNGNRLATGIRLANRRVFKASEAQDEYVGMGSTAAAVLLDGTKMTFAGVGDTRIYLCRTGNLIQLTEDDTWGSRIRSMDPAGLPGIAREGPMDHVLTKVLGASQEIEISVGERTLEEGDRLLLCSDGLYNAADHSAITAIVTGGLDVAPTVDALIRRALDGGGRDNITAVLVEYSAAAASV